MPSGQWQRGFTIMLFLSGFLLVFQIRAYEALRTASALPTRRLEDLSVLIRRQQESDRDLRDAVALLEQKLAQYRSAEASGSSLSGAMRRELADLHVVLGLTRLHGPALVVLLAPSRQRSAVPVAEDVAAVVNELWAAGAEGMAINHVRTMATQGIVPLQSGVRVGRRIIAAPYSIVAIGDPSTLEEALVVPGGIVDGLRGVGIVVALSRLPDVVVPARDTLPVFSTARPDSFP